MSFSSICSNNFHDYKLTLFSFAGLQDALAKNLLMSDRLVLTTRVLALNASSGALVNCAWWQRYGLELNDPRKLAVTAIEQGKPVDSELPW